MASPKAPSNDAELTPEDRALLLSRVYVLEPGVVVYQEIPLVTVESVRLMLDRLCELAFQWPTFIAILDLSAVRGRPSPPVSILVRERARVIAPRLSHVALVIRSNVALRAFTQVMTYALHVPRVSFHDTFDDALRSVMQDRAA